MKIFKAISVENGIESYLKESNSRLEELVIMVRSTSLSRMTRITVEALIVIDVHGKRI
jgi:hypothetical protein